MAEKLPVKQENSDVLGDPFIFAFIHDVKNMLVPIISRIELLQVPGISEEQRQDILKKMSDDCDVISNTMSTMVEICRCRSGLGCFVASKGNLSSVVFSAMDIISEPTMAKEVTIDNQIPEEVEVYTDQEAILGVFVNMLANAVKFSYRGGKIVVSAVNRDDMVECTIRDSGVGMNVEKVREILDENKFYHSPGTEGELGNGFGLMLCESLLRRAGTRLSYGNNDGGGAWFTFSLPLWQESLKQD